VNLSVAEKKITVLGAGKSGVAAALLAASLGAEVFVSDIGDVSGFTAGIERMRQYGIEYEFGGHSERAFDADFWILSPGIPLYSEAVRKAAAAGIEIISEVEFASRLIKGKIVAITGSNGKSTTTELTSLLLNSQGIKAFAVGNIGVPVSEKVMYENDEDTVFVIEMSSFQLETIKTFRPDVAVLLNMSPDHLDRYDSLEEYYNAKARIFLNLGKENFIVVNGDDQSAKKYAEESPAEKLEFSLNRKKDAYLGGEDIVIGGLRLSVNDIFLKGPHNYQNIMASLLAVKALKNDLDEEAIIGTLKEFKGLEHRMEYVDTIDGVEFYNDSKATTLESMLAALNSFSGKVILIAGGKSKGTDFKSARQVIEKKAGKVFALGNAGAELEEAWGDLVSVEKSRNLENVVKKAFDEAKKTRIPVLLSPACASFDMFKNFEERGDLFKEYVRELSYES
jgi:UDP-N-acetylmuramoylalanine--D-glutamate ligase